MKFKAMEYCPDCGTRVKEIDEIQYNYECLYCGTKFEFFRRERQPRSGKRVIEATLFYDYDGADIQ